jgi:hypothetical protein
VNLSERPLAPGDVRRPLTPLIGNLMSEYGEPQPGDIAPGQMGNDSAQSGNFTPGGKWQSYEQAQAHFQNTHGKK